MRLLLDANLSSKRIGEPLRQRGHDVRAVADEPDLEGLHDEAVLQLAAGDGRILVTRNSRHFAPTCRTWAEAAREHAGVILIWTLSARQFIEIVRGVEALLEERPTAADWLGVLAAM